MLSRKQKILNSFLRKSKLNSYLYEAGKEVFPERISCYKKEHLKYGKMFNLFNYSSSSEEIIKYAEILNEKFCTGKSSFWKKESEKYLVKAFSGFCNDMSDVYKIMTEIRDAEKEYTMSYDICVYLCTMLEDVPKYNALSSME